MLDYETITIEDLADFPLYAQDSKLEDKVNQYEMVWYLVNTLPHGNSPGLAKELFEKSGIFRDSNGNLEKEASDMMDALWEMDMEFISLDEMSLYEVVNDFIGVD